MAVAFFNPAPAFEPTLKTSYWISSIPKTGNSEEDARRMICGAVVEITVATLHGHEYDERRYFKLLVNLHHRSRDDPGVVCVFAAGAGTTAEEQQARKRQ